MGFLFFTLLVNSSLCRSIFGDDFSLFQNRLRGFGLQIRRITMHIRETSTMHKVAQPSK
jgi:hypothetical protein